MQGQAGSVRQVVHCHSFSEHIQRGGYKKVDCYAFLSIDLFVALATQLNLKLTLNNLKTHMVDFDRVIVYMW